MKHLLRIALAIMGIYLILIGVLYLLAPAPAESLFGASLPDRATAMVHGVTDLAVAFLCLSAVFRNQIAKSEYRFLLVFSGLHTLLFGLFIPLGIYTPAQAMPPSIIWGVLNGLLVFGGRNQSKTQTAINHHS